MFVFYGAPALRPLVEGGTTLINSARNVDAFSACFRRTFRVRDLTIFRDSLLLVRVHRLIAEGTCLFFHDSRMLPHPRSEFCTQLHNLGLTFLGERSSDNGSIAGRLQERRTECLRRDSRVGHDCVCGMRGAPLKSRQRGRHPLRLVQRDSDDQRRRQSKLECRSLTTKVKRD
jgi:hypothetical protein